MAYRRSRKFVFLGWLVAIGLVVFVVLTFGDDLLMRVPLG